MTDGVTDDPFAAHRRLLCTVAYGLLGAAADAEDVVLEVARTDGQITRIDAIANPGS